MKKIILAALACAAPVYAVQAQQVTYTWTTTNAHGGLQPTAASFEVPLSAVVSGQINYLDISNIQLAYPGLTFDSFTATGNGLDFAAFVNPTTGAFINHDANQGLGVIGYQGGLFSDTFLALTIDNYNASDSYNALNHGAPDAGFPTAGHWTASFPTITSSVPESATWAMMLLGFGGIGFSMRRRESTKLQLS